MSLLRFASVGGGFSDGVSPKVVKVSAAVKRSASLFWWASVSVGELSGRRDTVEVRMVVDG